MACGSHIFLISPQCSANLLLNSHSPLILQEDYDASRLATAADFETRAPFFSVDSKLSAVLDGDADDGDADDDGGDDGVDGTYVDCNGNSFATVAIGKKRRFGVPG